MFLEGRACFRQRVNETRGKENLPAREFSGGGKRWLASFRRSTANGIAVPTTPMLRTARAPAILIASEGMLLANAVSSPSDCFGGRGE